MPRISFVAAPPPALRGVSFDPPLPSEVAAMVDELSLGHALKVSTQYDQRFWLSENLSGFTITDLPFGVGWDATDSMPGGADRPGVLTQFVTGDVATIGAALSDRDRIATFQQQLEVVYPEGKRERTDIATTLAWADERYSGGGYAVYAPGQMTRFWPLLREAHGAIRFAGEHTESLAGYMESAVRSGKTGGSGHRVGTTLTSGSRRHVASRWSEPDGQGILQSGVGTVSHPCHITVGSDQDSGGGGDLTEYRQFPRADMISLDQTHPVGPPGNLESAPLTEVHQHRRTVVKQGERSPRPVIGHQVQIGHAPPDERVPVAEFVVDVQPGKHAGNRLPRPVHAQQVSQDIVQRCGPFAGSGQRSLRHGVVQDPGTDRMTFVVVGVEETVR